MMNLKKILVVDDEADMRIFVSTVVETSGFQPVPAEDGTKALDLARSEPPSLVILDVMMPRKNGYELCDELKASDEYKGIAVVLLTAVADRVTTSTYTHRDMLESEAEDYMPKPVEPAELLERIKSWVS